MPFDRISNNLNPIKVLLIEDGETQRWLTSTFLNQQEDIVCTVAADGLEGLERAWTEKPDVILLDLVLPGMDGLEVLRRYKSNGGPAAVIVLSRARHDAVSDMAFSYGAAHFFSKPYSLPQLLPYIRSFGAGLDRNYQALLLKMNASPGWKGFRQAARCASLLSRDREELMKVIYLQAAKELNQEPDRVEINIRRLIEQLHKNQSPLYRQMVPHPDAERPPSNREFLLLLIQAATFPL